MANEKPILETNEDVIKDNASADKKPVSKRKTAVKRTTNVKKETTAKATPKLIANPTKEVNPAKEKRATAKLVAGSTIEVADSTIEKVLNTGKKTSKIVTQAGGVILSKSVQTTKVIAGMYLKAGKGAVKAGKNLLTDTTKIMMDNQKKVADVSKTAIKETIETLKEANFVENPLRKKKK